MAIIALEVHSLTRHGNETTIGSKCNNEGELGLGVHKGQ